MPASRYYARLKDKVEDAVDMVGDAVSDVAESVSRDILQLSDTVDQQEVDMPTPPACFYTPDDGWLTQPAGASEAWKPPANLTDLRCYWPNAVLGELQIEVLQAEDLPSARFGLGRIDPYALILHERMSARTSTVWNNDHPKWSALSSARGFRLPITSPYSSVFVAVQDDNHVQDEPLGRIAIHLGSYRPNTEYDCWFSLQHSPMAKHSSKYGAVRIRFSVRFHDNRRRVLEVIPQLPGPSYVADFHRGASRKAAAYAYRGGRYYSKRRFRWRILQSYVNELRDSAETLIARVRAVLFWQLPLMSFSLLVGFQLLVTYPWAFGASIPLTALIVLQRNLWFERPLPPIRSRMSICGIMLMALLNRSPEPLSTSPTGCGTDDSDSEGKSSGEDDDEEEADGEAAVTRELTRVGGSKASLRPPRSASELLTASVSRFGERLRVLIRGKPGHSYADVTAKIAAEVEELVQEEWEDAMEQEDAKLGEERLQKPSVYRHLVDPLDAVRPPPMPPHRRSCSRRRLGRCTCNRDAPSMSYPSYPSLHQGCPPHPCFHHLQPSHASLSRHVASLAMAPPNRSWRPRWAPSRTCVRAP